MLTRGFSFPEALEFLANKAGIPMEASHKNPEQLAREKKLEEEKKLFLKLNRYAARFYQEQLEGAGGALARDYAQKREISRDSLLAFAIGYAPDSWTALRDYFLRIKAPLLKAYELGLLRTKGGEKPKADGSNLFDTFRNRLVFPIRDPNGEVLGFGGRWLGSASADAPKYLNSPESSVYEKDKVLYNLDQARKSIRDMGAVVLVEGYMDCLTLVQAGFPNVLANCGTALTKSQAALLRKLAPKVICLYDSDSAGQAASERAMNLFLENDGFPLLGAKLPDGKDPDEFLRARGEAGRLQMAEILQNSPALLDLWAEKEIREAPHSLQGRAEALDKVAQKLAKLRDDLWIQARSPGLAKGLQLEPELVAEALWKYRKSLRSGAQKNVNAKTAPNFPQKSQVERQKKGEKSKPFQHSNGKREFGFDRRFLSDLMKNPNWIGTLRERMAAGSLPVLSYVHDPGIKAVLEKILEPLQAGESEEERTQEALELSRGQPELRSIWSEALVRIEEALPDSELEAALARLKDESMKRQAAELQQKIDEAEKKGDTAASGALLMELMELRRQRAQR
jgi:DNA primase